MQTVITYLLSPLSPLHSLLGADVGPLCKHQHAMVKACSHIHNGSERAHEL